MKSKFIINELWMLSIAGAFQRAKIYAPNAPEIDKKEFKKGLKIYLESIVQTHYFNRVNQQKHLENIEALSNYSKKFSALLANGSLNFGVSQKILNLFLKYMWCLKLIPTPPHFPVDRMIQETLNKEAKKNGLKTRHITSWTQFQDKKEYLEVIYFAKNIIAEVKAYENLSLAELELKLFDRR